MPYTAPTADELQATFPAFAAVADATVDFWIGRAGRIVDESWVEDDYQMGQMLLAAHYMTLNGLGTGAAAAAAAAGASGFRRMKSGTFELERADSASGGSADGFSSTSYGAQFLNLLRANRGGPRVTPTGTWPPPYPPVLL